VLGATCGIGRLAQLVSSAGLTVRARSAVVHCPRFLAVLVADLLSRGTSSETQRRFLRWLQPFEALGRLPTRYLSGHFVAIRATRT
jgi:hypothetical protein